jgi:hypothetical protein
MERLFYMDYPDNLRLILLLMVVLVLQSGCTVNQPLVPTLIPTAVVVIQAIATPEALSTPARELPPTFTATPSLTPPPTITPQPTRTASATFDVRLLTPSPTPIRPTNTPLPPTRWVRYDTPLNKVAFNRPESMRVMEGRDQILLNGRVDLRQGSLSDGSLVLFFYRTDSGSLPSDIDLSDPVVFIRWIRDLSFSGMGAEIKEISAPQTRTYNGYTGARTIVNRVGSYGIDQIYYLAVLFHESRIVFVQANAERADGGELITSVTEALLNSIELR